MKRTKRKQRLARRLKRKERQNAGNIRFKPARASKYLQWLKKDYRKHPDMVAILYLRVSARSQDHKKNLRNHEKVLRRKLKHLGIRVIGCYCEVGSGWITDHTRGVLRQAVRQARQLKNAVILTTSSDRFLRNRNFMVDNLDLRPTEVEFKKLVKLTCGVPFVTYLPPNMAPRKVRGYQSKWGQRAKGNKGGRTIIKRPGYKKSRRKKKLPDVDRLLRQGKNPTDIARKVKIARSTVSDWIKRYC